MHSEQASWTKQAGGEAVVTHMSAPGARSGKVRLYKCAAEHGVLFCSLQWGKGDRGLRDLRGATLIFISNSASDCITRSRSLGDSRGSAPDV